MDTMIGARALRRTIYIMSSDVISNQFLQFYLTFNSDDCQWIFAILLSVAPIPGFCNQRCLFPFAVSQLFSVIHHMLEQGFGWLSIPYEINASKGCFSILGRAAFHPADHMSAYPLVKEWLSWI